MCHISKGPLCLYKPFDEIGIDYYRAYVAYDELTSMPTHYNEPEAARHIINKYYWDSKESIKIFNEKLTSRTRLVIVLMSIVISLLFVGLLVVLCVRQRKKLFTSSVNEDIVGSEVLKIS
eukprot:TRINITY_DN14863_c0_g1_i1.p2 TRINITY_DN14863_c0_g1~~TRINITY_DN14863_c0_g1_i1.p2  ORF type:complete len:120 (+),score=5.12 TRINITY_DN14863_c0_g1_i1:786-1145(+)